MEITESMVYWATRLDGIQTALELMTIFSAVLWLACLIGLVISLVEENNAIRRIFIPLVIVFLIAFVCCGVGRVLTPSTKEYIAIKIIPAIASSKELKGEAKEWYVLLKKYIQDNVKQEDSK